MELHLADAWHVDHTLATLSTLGGDLEHQREETELREQSRVLHPYSKDHGVNRMSRACAFLYSVDDDTRGVGSSRNIKTDFQGG